MTERNEVPQKSAATFTANLADEAQKVAWIADRPGAAVAMARMFQQTCQEDPTLLKMARQWDQLGREVLDAERDAERSFLPPF